VLGQLLSFRGATGGPKARCLAANEVAAKEKGEQQKGKEESHQKRGTIRTRSGKREYAATREKIIKRREEKRHSTQGR